jgi:hypothetical protein
VNSYSHILPQLRYVVFPRIVSRPTRQGPITKRENDILREGFPCLGRRAVCSAIHQSWAVAEVGRPHQGAELMASLLESSTTSDGFSQLEVFLIHRLISHCSADSRASEADLTWNGPTNVDPHNNSYLIRILRNEIRENGPNYAVLNNLGCLSYLTGSKVRSWRTFCWAYKMSFFDRLVGLNLATVSFELNYSSLGNTLLEAHRWRFV